MMERLTQKEILSAINLWLRENNRIDPSRVGTLQYKFGIVGEPLIQLVGDNCKTPNAGDVYFDWSFEEMKNVESMSVHRSKRLK